jgi:hypothetical protein
MRFRGPPALKDRFVTQQPVQVIVIHHTSFRCHTGETSESLARKRSRPRESRAFKVPSGNPRLWAAAVTSSSWKLIE